MPLRSFPDLEAAVAELLAPLVPDGHVNDSTPADLEARLPFLRMSAFAGSDDNWTDEAVMDVDSFAANRSDARDLAEAARQLLNAAPHHLTAVVIDRCQTVQRPSRTPWDNPAVHRFTGTYRITARR